MNSMKKGYKFGWKVIDTWGLNHQGKKVSSFAPALAKVTYDFDKPTMRVKGCGPLAVFKDEASARKFCNLAGYLILPCKYILTKLKRKALWYTYVGDMRHNKFRKEASDFPEGTVLADAVQILDAKEGKKIFGFTFIK